MARVELKDVRLWEGSTPAAILGAKECGLDISVEEHDVTTQEDIQSAFQKIYAAGLVDSTMEISGGVVAATTGNDTKAICDKALAGTTLSMSFKMGADTYTCSAFFTKFSVKGGTSRGDATFSGTLRVMNALTASA